MYMSLARAVLIIGSCAAVAAAGPITYSFATVDFPGAYSTRITGINSSGVLSGFYDPTSSSFAAGFRDSGGVFNHFVDPAAVLGTVANGLNSAGQIVGDYGTGSIFADELHGFLDNSGSFTTLDDPSAGPQGTAAYGINSAGTVGGVYFDAAGFQHGFLESGGTYSTQDVAGGFNSAIYGLNDSGQTTGYFVDAGGAHGFIRTGGAVTALNFPGSNRTYAQGINNSGTVAGQFNFNLSTMNFSHGFVYSGGTYQQIDFPGALETEIYGINDAGQLVGYYFNDPTIFPSVLHGFVATPEPNQTPEPGTAMLVLSGFVCLAVSRSASRRRWLR